tara:strand:+ start:1997 stop:3205 length:1209 start_codon:yes stop_codon:yes gene_type:complete
MAAEEKPNMKHLLIYSKLDNTKTGKIIYEEIKNIKKIDENFGDIKQIFTTYFAGNNMHSSKLKKTSYENIFKLSCDNDEKTTNCAITNIEANTLIELSKDERLFKYSTIEEKNLKMIFESDIDEKTFNDNINSSNKLDAEEIDSGKQNKENLSEKSPDDSNAGSDNQSNIGDISSVSGNNSFPEEVFVESVLSKELYDDIIKSMSSNKVFNKNIKFGNVKDMRYKFVGLIVENIKAEFDLNSSGNFINFLRFRMNDSNNKIILPIAKNIADYICEQTKSAPYEFKCIDSLDNKTTIYEITFDYSDQDSYNKCIFKFKNYENKSQSNIRSAPKSSQKTVMSSSKPVVKDSFKVSRSFTNLQSLFDTGKINGDFYTRSLNQLNDDNKISDEAYEKEILKIQSVN